MSHHTGKVLLTALSLTVGRVQELSLQLVKLAIGTRSLWTEDLLLSYRLIWIVIDLEVANTVVF